MIPQLTTKTVVGQRSYNFGFDYLARDFVKVEVDGKLLEYDKDYTVNGRTVEFVVTPTEVKPLYIYRKTDTNTLVEWRDSSIMAAKDLNLQYKQQAHLAEELEANTALSIDAVAKVKQMKTDVEKLRNETAEIAGGEFLRLSDWERKKNELEKDLLTIKSEIKTSITEAESNTTSKINESKQQVESIKSKITAVETSNEEKQTEINRHLKDITKVLQGKDLTLTPLIDWERLLTADQNALIKNTVYGVSYYNNTVNKAGRAVVYLKNDFTEYDELLIVYQFGDVWNTSTLSIPTWQLDSALASGRALFILPIGSYYKCSLYSYKHPNWEPNNVSTTREFLIYNTDIKFCEIYGIKYFDKEKN